MTDIPSTNLITVDEAIAILDAIPAAPTIENIDLLVADGRTLAIDVIADRDYPNFDKSLVDGYALRSADATGAALRDIGEIAAGGRFDRTLATGECVAIMTGAPLPAGADAVCPVESTRANGGLITISEKMTPGRFIERQAAHWRRGDLLLPVGTQLTPAGLSVAACVGATLLKVFARPRVGVLTTGNEVIPIDQTPGHVQLRDSNHILISTLLRRVGCEPISLGHAADDPADIAARLQREDLDAICITGGMSMGRHDHVPAVMRQLGYTFAVTKLRMRPGKPFVVATRDRSPILFGLPGNPLSGFVCVVRLASRLLLRMQGRPPEPAWESLPLQNDLPANDVREFYQPAVADRGILTPLFGRGSADVLTLARANVLLRRPPDAPAARAGEMVPFIRVP